MKCDPITPAQKDSLLKEWHSLDLEFQKMLVRKYLQDCRKGHKDCGWLEYLKNVFRIQAYWKVVDLM